ncbi:major surface protease, GP63, putative [Bodo saltans]|uniref:Leishmanolysin-like peptidase n=1 Tax=Bodo saltans TaxID=75058 RepID=A0A0S4IN60_BODSA|nr:major surface protease, GP63, putative [Bodo saltans]|eukprot:CUF60833.1 major surface protease, GP63, putative [Bodo saltans]
MSFISHLICCAAVLTVITLYCAAASPTTFSRPHQHRCAHDDQEMHPVLHNHGHDRTVPQRRTNRRLDIESSSTSGSESTSASDSPFRIVVSTLDLNITGKYCNSSVSTAPDFMGGSIQCTAESVLTDAKRFLLVNVIIPRAIQMHQERIRVAQPMTHNITITQQTVCPYFTTPASDIAYGVPDADFVLYVAAGLTTGATIAWAGFCQLDEFGRPLTGRMIFNPKYIPTNITDTVGLNTAIRTAAHELTHALGFSSSSILGNASLTATVTGVRGKTTSTHVITDPGVVDVARLHFNCTNLTFVELEDDGSSGTAGSHWEAHNHFDELMVGLAGKCLYTSLTVAMLVASGFYVEIPVNASSNTSTAIGDELSFSPASDNHNVQFGRDAGCPFLTMPCVSNNTLLLPSGGRTPMFCNDTITSSSQQLTQGHIGCLWDRSAMGACSTGWATGVQPYVTTYFTQDLSTRPSASSFLVGTTPLVDSCPLSVTMQYACSNAAGASENDAVFGSYFGAGSRCLDTANVIDRIHSAETYQGTCMLVRCVGGTRIQFAVGASSTSAAKWTDCPHNGLTAVVGTGNSAYLGTVHCPLAAELCWDTSLFVTEASVTTTAAPTTTTTKPTTTQAPTTTTTSRPATTTQTAVPTTTQAQTLTTTSTPILATSTAASVTTLAPPPPTTTAIPRTTPTPTAAKNVTAMFTLLASPSYTVNQLLTDIRAVLSLTSNPASWDVKDNGTVVEISFQSSAERDTILNAVAASQSHEASSSGSTPFSGVLSAVAIMATNAPATTTTAPAAPSSSCSFCPSTVTIIIICGGAAVLILIAVAIWWYRRKTLREIEEVHASYSEDKLSKLRLNAAGAPGSPVLVAPHHHHHAVVQRNPSQQPPVIRMHRAPPRPQVEDFDFDNL